ncbi:CpsD/CapB family tyrosine-protein kinase [Paenibacillus aurantiacus]|uniref:non-specific protein-tyrosine kinase n=1 Tax=Paenibacillus aurantiacus TaxID=1936118 RepID=A0ABV5KIK9_9BACL
MAPNRQKKELEFLSKGLTSYLHPESATAEQFRGIRASILLRQDGGGARSLVVTSPGRGEGKTTVAMNLAVSLAMKGSRVLLVDANLRRPDASGAFQLLDYPGLSDVLLASVELGDAARRTEMGRLDVLAGGRSRDMALDLLDSERMRAVIEAGRRNYDLVLIDAGAVLEASEAKTLAHFCESAVLVVREGRTNAKALGDAKATLEYAGAQVLGVIVNKR